MQRRTVKVVLAILIIASLVLVLAPTAMSNGMHGHGNGGKGMCGKIENIDQVYHSIAVVGAKDGAVTFDILNSAIKEKNGNVSVMKFDKPIEVTIYSSNGTVVMARPNKENNTTRPHIKPTKTNYNDATLSPAGASAIITARNITVVSKDKNGSTMQFTGMSVYLPDGSVKSYTFTKPVLIVTSWKDKTKKIVADSTFWSNMQDALKGTAKFPANAAPVPLKTIDAKK